jgi:hypothetical protein
MGEAKRRKDASSLYGRVPKKGFGLVISNPVMIEGSSFRIGGGLDPQELRFWLLFWDRLDWPDSKIISFPLGEAEILRKEGILTRTPGKNFISGDGATLFAQGHLDAFRQHTIEEPGLWALAEGDRSFLVRSSDFGASGGTQFALYEAIPVPDKEVPLEKILEFKSKRRDELLALRIEIDEVFARTMKAGTEEGYRKAIFEIDQRCVDVLKVAKEMRWPLRFVDWKSNFSLDLIQLGAAFAAGYSIPGPVGLQLSSGLVAAWGAAKAGAAKATIEFSGITWTKNPVKNHPFRYVSSYHDKLFK